MVPQWFVERTWGLPSDKHRLAGEAGQPADRTSKSVRCLYKGRLSECVNATTVSVSPGRAAIDDNRIRQFLLRDGFVINREVSPRDAKIFVARLEHRVSDSRNVFDEGLEEAIPIA